MNLTVVSNKHGRLMSEIEAIDSPLSCSSGDLYILIDMMKTTHSILLLPGGSDNSVRRSVRESSSIETPSATTDDFSDSRKVL